MEEIQIPTKIYSGTDSLDRLQDLHGKTILMVCDAFLPNTPTLKTICGELDSSNQIEIFSDVKPDPPLKNIMKGVEQFTTLKPNVMLGIGGGSAIDTGKAIRFFGEKITNTCLDCFIAIPTTSGTGSEVTNTSVISDTENQRKFPIMEDYLTPDIALLDPQLVMTAPKSVTAYSGLDVLTHSLESLVAKGANTLTDALAEKGVDVITHHLVTCYKHGDNTAARKVVHEASCGAGIAFNNAGLGFCHALAHQLGANFHVPHGLANAMLLPYVVSYNAEHDEVAMHKYAIAAKKAGLAPQGMADRVAVRRLINQIRLMMRQMDCPATLQSFGIDAKDALAATDTIVANAKLDATFPGNPVVPSDEDLVAVYHQIIK
ncbi:1-propanol dehydrogenase PduQ [Levilactobacillus namurensis]|uniref:1-propanol dehydrogenase PduQ n=1 Tax=Levilactobacillus namurensis TaxID=380393 RepID=UPI001D1AC83D|nr:1-propanol dehydrogenase PduQ [Levilactobacillus namurensis]HJE44810.1 iron-containing alcohol dehydrogenase [Levilactobacillus namurensis]